MKNDTSKPLYITSSLDFATFLIEMGVRYIKCQWRSHEGMVWIFRNEEGSDTIERLDRIWTAKEQVSICPRTFIETRHRLVSGIKDHKRNK